MVTGLTGVTGLSGFALVSLAAVAAMAPLVACSSSDRVAPVETTPASTNQTTEPAPPNDSTNQKPSTPRNPDEAQAPEISSVDPSRAMVGTVGPSIVVTGNNFVPRSIVQLDGAPLATSFVSETELRATIPTSKLATVGTLRLSVGTSAPGGGASREISFEVENPVASVTSLSPLSVLAGSAQTLVHLTGTGFVSGAKVIFGGNELATTFVSTTSLDAIVPANLLTAFGSVPVKVRNPTPGGGDSGSIAFTVANPDAAIQNINPSAAFVGSAAVTMTVNGGGFVNASNVVFNGNALATTFVNGGQLTATVPATMLGAAGDFPVTVSNPPPGGGVSTPVVFRVQYPVPSLSSPLSPATIGAGAGPTDVTVTGVGFFITSQITFDNAPAATTYVDSTHLKATLSAAQLATAGAIAVRVVNGTPGGGTSAALSFTVTNPAPQITGLNPTSVPAASPDRTITITGTGFVPSSIVKGGGTILSSNYVSNTQLTAVVPSTQLVNPGSVGITVTNPAPGGGSSAAKNLIIGCDTSGVDVPLTTVGTLTTLQTNFTSASKGSRFSASSSCAVTTIDPSKQQPVRSWIVQNTTGQTVTLSAWADCSTITNGDAFLTFYRRPTVPTTDAERLACASAVSEGINGEGGYSSPDSGGSQYCPGLTKANGGGLVLGVCEKAVVQIQPWDVASATYPAPPQIRVKPE
ncbi:hypothetical protein AKJ09_05220 [Labilithrix luteola]|uniref:IPT/TIG domain-containing protein n=1 Tax=Labilithrix luteola TaxID=1391654 RepID=A0A0K1PYT3_9BACT|nr:hypothetical protein AKJ09_05220 [Labilithrix luteola]